MFRQIENVVYDLGGVLVDLDIDRCRAAFRSLGMEAAARLVDPCYPAEVFGQLEEGRIAFAGACERLRALSGTPEVDDERIAWAFGEFLTGIPQAKIDQIVRLRERGVRTYVLSNNNPASMRFIRAMFARSGRTMDDCFDKIYLSYELGLLKPSPEIFRTMLADSGMQPDRTLFIDDGEKNVAAARKLGLAVYRPAAGEDFGALLDQIGR